MKSKKLIELGLKTTKRCYEEELTKGHLYAAEALKMKGYALCWVLDRYWSDVITET